MNINEDGCWPWGWPWPWWWSVYARYPDIPLSYWKKRLCLHVKKLLHEICVGPERTEYCNRFEYITRKSLWKTLLTSIHLRPVYPYRTELKARNEPYSLVYLHMYILPSSGSEVLRSYNNTGREITMISLGNIALSLKDWVMALKSDYTVISHFLPPFLLAQRASCILFWCWHGCGPLHQMTVWRTWPIPWHGMAQCICKAPPECLVICLSLSHRCSCGEHWHSLSTPDS